MKDFNEMSLVVESWEKATMKPEFEEQVPALIFRHFFELAPRSKQAFGLRRNFDPTVENLAKNGVAVLHVVRMLHMLNLVLTMEGPPEMLYNVLEDLGRRHLKYKANAQMIPLMGEAVLRSLNKWLGDDDWDENTQAAWESVFDLIENRMAKGMAK